MRGGPGDDERWRCKMKNAAGYIGLMMRQTPRFSKAARTAWRDMGRAYTDGGRLFSSHSARWLPSRPLRFRAGRYVPAPAGAGMTCTGADSLRAAVRAAPMNAADKETAQTHAKVFRANGHLRYARAGHERIIHLLRYARTELVRVIMMYANAETHDVFICTIFIGEMIIEALEAFRHGQI